MTRVAIVGTGLLGRGIADVVLRAGYPVILHDVSAAKLVAAREALGPAAGLTGTEVRMEPELEVAVGAADIVIEAVVEDLDLKQQLFARMGEASREALLMSNSSVLPISRIAERTAHAERAIGTHWWNPPQLIPVVEVIRGRQTSEAVVQDTVRFLASLGKTPVRIERDLPGFVGNRLQHALWREALALVSGGICPPQDVDRIIGASLGASLEQRGPVAEMNHLGSDEVARDFALSLAVISSDPYPCRLLRQRVAAGQLGAKSGQGFLSWPPGARERAAARLSAHVERRLGRLPAAPEPRRASLTHEEQLLARRLRVALWREALAMVGDGVCSAVTVDLVATNTIGLRLTAMGPVENADYVGLDLTLAIHEALLPSLNVSLEGPALLARAALAGGLS
jgi:3-hydroxybutyryl-CoA dehydrogenase